MAKNWGILLLSALLLGQCYQQTEANSDKAEEYMVSVIHELKPICHFTLTKGTELFKKVIHDISVLKTPDEELEKDIKEMSDFVKAAEEHEHSEKNPDKFDEEAYKLGETFWDIIEKHNSTELKTPTMEDVLIDMALHKNGYEHFEEEFYKHFMEMAEKFQTLTETYIASLTPEEHEAKKSLTEWFQKFKNEESVEKKEELFEELLKTVVLHKE